MFHRIYQGMPVESRIAFLFCLFNIRLLDIMSRSVQRFLLRRFRLCFSLFRFLYAFQFTHEIRKPGKAERIYKVCAVLSVLMQHHNIADRKGMPLIICRVVYVEFLIDCFQRCALRPPLQPGKFAHIDKVVILRLNGIEIVFYNSPAL